VLDFLLLPSWLSPVIYSLKFQVLRGPLFCPDVLWRSPPPCSPLTGSTGLDRPGKRSYSDRSGTSVQQTTEVLPMPPRGTLKIGQRVIFGLGAWLSDLWMLTLALRYFSFLSVHRGCLSGSRYSGFAVTPTAAPVRSPPGCVVKKSTDVFRCSCSPLACFARVLLPGLTEALL